MSQIFLFDKCIKIFKMYLPWFLIFIDMSIESEKFVPDSTTQLSVNGIKISADGKPISETWELVQPVVDEINFVKKGVLWLPESVASNNSWETNDEISEYIFNWKKVEVISWCFTWKDAEIECKKRKGRLPTEPELKMFYKHYTEKNPKWKEDDGVITENNPLGLSASTYWSATELAYNTTYAWSVNFGDGNTNGLDKTDTYRVVCIRD